MSLREERDPVVSGTARNCNHRQAEIRVSGPDVGFSGPAGPPACGPAPAAASGWPVVEDFWPTGSVALGETTPEGRSRQAEHVCDLPNGVPLREQGLRGAEVQLIPRPPELHALGSRSCNTGLHTLSDEVVLQLGDAGDHGVERLADARTAVHLLA